MTKADMMEGHAENATKQDMDSQAINNITLDKAHTSRKDDPSEAKNSLSNGTVTTHNVSETVSFMISGTTTDHF